MKSSYRKEIIQDLVGRLPYHPFYEVIEGNKSVGRVENAHITTEDYGVLIDGNYTYPIHKIRLYLRPMASMTKEEREEYISTKQKLVLDTDKQGEIKEAIYYDTYKTYDWLNKNHFDYRGLIPKGLANKLETD